MGLCGFSDFFRPKTRTLTEITIFKVDFTRTDLFRGFGTNFGGDFFFYFGDILKILREIP